MDKVLSFIPGILQRGFHCRNGFFIPVGVDDYLLRFPALPLPQAANANTILTAINDSSIPFSVFIMINSTP